ncbi:MULTISPECIES: hypothetical protein [unclassified Schaalia]|uniref:hypothetical protein n=1 Tax=unclassified Schaalia TaxID=2691889 RepID=UPI001E504C8E|nr:MULTISPECIES: hypothetical protein [unclassified Schaalia]MCD4550071.1 hypothetical protein [Schaalia sp. lx-260]MCD4557862.1 hypothetical protein [Schaalia sp. lx-100]
MSHIVDSHLQPAPWQATADVIAIVIATLVLVFSAAVAAFASESLGALVICSLVLVALIGITPRLYSYAHRSEI